MSDHPFTYTTPVTSETTFVGRKAEIDSILRAFWAPVHDSVAVIGERKIGVTSLILELRKRLDQDQKLAASREFPTIVVYIDLSLWVPHEKYSFWGEVANLLARECYRRGLNVDSVTGAYLSKDRSGELPLDEFIKAVQSVIVACGNPKSRIIFLLDGMQSFIRRHDSVDLFPYLRYLITGSEVGSNVTVLISGNVKFLSEMSTAEGGSPLRNVLYIRFLKALSASELSELFEKSPRYLGPDERTEIFQASGGHPFLAQFLLAKLNDDPQNDVQAAARAFVRERNDFESWYLRHLDILSSRIFTSLDSESKPLSLSHIVTKIAQTVRHDRALAKYLDANGGVETTSISVRESLRRLECIGIVRQNELNSEFEANCQMFRDWFRLYGIRSLTQVQEGWMPTDQQTEARIEKEDSQVSPIEPDATLNSNSQTDIGAGDRVSARLPHLPMHGRSLIVFLCHSADDKPVVREIYRRLLSENISPWLDEEKLLAGQDWQLEISKAVRDADAVIVCLSKHSINKEGYLQKELRQAMDVADEKPDGTIYIIPLRLEACEVPERLRRWQWVDYFEPQGFDRLMRALRNRAEEIGAEL